MQLLLHFFLHDRSDVCRRYLLFSIVLLILVNEPVLFDRLVHG